MPRPNDKPAAATARSRPGRSRLAKLVAVAITLAVSALIVETGSWFFITKVAQKTGRRGRSEKILDQHREFKLAPHSARDQRIINSQGFRRRGDVEQEKPEGTYRIFLMGGSAAFGSGARAPFPVYPVANEDTIAARLEQGLNGLGTGISFEVINAAVGGYRTHHHLVYLNQTLLDYDPDMVLFMDGHNDHYFLAPEWRQFTPMMRQVDSLNDPSLGLVLGTSLHWLARRSWFFHGAWMVHQRWKSWEHDPLAVGRARGNLDDYEPLARRTFLKMIKRNVLILQDEDMIPIVFLQPELVLQPEETLTPEERELRRIELGLHPPDYPEKVAGIYEQLIPLLTELSDEYEFEFFDLNPIFQAEAEPCFVDFAHMSPRGNELIAAYMQERIRERLMREGTLSGSVPAP